MQLHHGESCALGEKIRSSSLCRRQEDKMQGLDVERAFIYRQIDLFVIARRVFQNSERRKVVQRVPDEFERALSCAVDHLVFKSFLTVLRYPLFEIV
jgi:hypothetical protein